MKQCPLLEEMKMSKPFDPPDLELYFNLLKTYEMLEDEFTHFFAQYDLSPNQYNVLRILAGAGQDGLSCQEIVNRVVHRVPDITRMVDRLIEKRLVKRVRSREDRRVVRITLTELGKKKSNAIRSPLKKFVTNLFGDISEEDQALVNRVLYQLRGVPI